MDKLEEVLGSSIIFDQIPTDKYSNVIKCLDGIRKSFSRDESIINIGDFTRLAGIVISGTVETAFFDENGNQISVNFLHAGDTFGTDLAFSSDEPSPLRLRALKNSEVLFLRFENLLEITKEHCPYRAKITTNLLIDFARQTQFLNLRIRIMGQKYLRDKLKVYLQTLKMDEKGCINLPFNRRELAEFLYADRSALSRELARMRDDGILDFSGNMIRIKDMSFLEN